LTVLPPVNPYGSQVDTDVDGYAAGSSFLLTDDAPVGTYYVLGKYDAAQAGSLVWLVTVTAPGTSISLPAYFDGENHGLSHATTFVPDGGMTLMLLGGALVGLGALRLRFAA
jgi:hypothetical protein